MNNSAKVIIRDNDEIAPEAKLWRFLDLTKLVHLLINEELFFPSLKSLSRDDGYEGRYTDAQMARLFEIAKEMIDSLEISEDSKAKKLIILKKNHETSHNPKFLDQVFVSSWFMSEAESMAMWKIYSDQGKGIAVVSTFEKLHEVLQTSQTQEELVIGKTNYIDFDDHQMDIYDTLQPIFQKREAYHYEKELRVVAHHFDNPDLEVLTGIKVKANPALFIDEIMVGPQVEPWVERLLVQLLKQLHQSFRVTRSKMLSDS